MIGITESDLYNLILDFVYGEAQVDGNVAICSTSSGWSESSSNPRRSIASALGFSSSAT